MVCNVIQFFVAGNSSPFTFSWEIDKFDLANADVSVKDGNVTVKCGSITVPTTDYTVTKDAAADKVTVTATKDSKNYTGSKTVSADVAPEEKPDAPMISNVKVVGNKATVILSGEASGAAGYDYVISTDRDCITNKAYDGVSKNQATASTTFDYVQQGTYYAYCHDSLQLFRLESFFSYAHKNIQTAKIRIFIQSGYFWFNIVMPYIVVK